jgi:site-specific recombinase XerD
MTNDLVPATSSVSPVVALLARCVSERTRTSTLQSLTTIARILLASEKAAAPDVPWHELKPEHVDAVVAALNARYAPGSVNVYLSALRGMVKTLWRMQLISSEQRERLLDFKPRSMQDRPLAGRCLSSGEIDKLFAAASEMPGAVGKRDAAILALAYYAGMRRDEIAEAPGAWLSGDKITVIGKGRKPRVIPLSSAARRHLAAWFQVCPKTVDLPIIRRLSKHEGTTTAGLSGSGVYMILEDLGKLAGVAEFTPHDLRRTFITELLARGTDVVTVAKMAGHGSTATTMRYDRRPAQVAAAAVETLENKP